MPVLTQLAAIAPCPVPVKLEAAESNWRQWKAKGGTVPAGHTCEVVTLLNYSPASSTVTCYPTGSKPTGGSNGDSGNGCNGGNGVTDDHRNNSSNSNDGNGGNGANKGNDDHGNNGNNGNCGNSKNNNSGNNGCNGSKNDNGDNNSNVNKPPTVTSSGARFEVGVVAGIFAAAWLVAVAL